MVSKLKIQASRNFGQPPLFVRHSSQETQQPGQFALQIIARDKIVKAKGAKGIKTKCVGNGVKAKGVKGTKSCECHEGWGQGEGHEG